MQGQSSEIYEEYFNDLKSIVTYLNTEGIFILRVTDVYNFKYVVVSCKNYQQI